MLSAREAINGASGGVNVVQRTFIVEFRHVPRGHGPDFAVMNGQLIGKGLVGRTSPARYKGALVTAGGRQLPHDSASRTVDLVDIAFRNDRRSRDRGGVEVGAIKRQVTNRVRHQGRRTPDTDTGLGIGAVDL